MLSYYKQSKERRLELIWASDDVSQGTVILQAAKVCLGLKWGSDGTSVTALILQAEQSDIVFSQSG
jgi:hypothetical protein